MRNLLGVFLVALVAQSVSAVILITETGKRVPGYLVSMTATEVVIRVPVQGGESRIERFPRKSVSVLESFKPERLEALQPGNPAAYRDYAEELVARKDDPEARDLALRLFVIAASLDPEKLGKGCMATAAGIARTPQEERRLRAVAYLLDTRHDQSLIQEKAAKAPPSKGNGLPGDPKGKAFMAALKAYRRGQYAEAEKQANIPGVETYFQLVGPIQHAGFLQACAKAAGVKTPPDPSSDLARKILQLELESDEKIGQPAEGRKNPWSIALTPDSRRVPPLPSLANVTEFSPTDSVYSKGVWSMPPKP